MRVEDYLNDKIQTNSDLENLNSLLDNVRKQQSLLKQQLQEAESALRNSRIASEGHSADLLRHTQAFQKKQADIDRRLLIVTQSETSGDAVLKFDSSMERLRRLDIATGYIELLAEVDKLSLDASKNFKVSPQAALQPYLRLQNILVALKDAQPAAEDAAPHLIDHVDNAARTLWRNMKIAFASDFEETLKRIKWPTKDAILENKIKQEWIDGVEKLLDLQEPELKDRGTDSGATISQEEPLVLLPLEVMMKPLELRFKYHFDSDRPTNRPDKPEYFLSHVIGLLNTYDAFFAEHLQPILHKRFTKTGLGFMPAYLDSTSALTTALLPMLRRKISSFLPQISKQPQLLSHFIHELISFDVNLTEDWGYRKDHGVQEWKGLAWEVLVKWGWFGRWLDVEKNFALSRYQNIIDQKASGEIDYDSVDESATKPTFSAVQVNDLLETITDRYRPLSSFTQKLRFLIDIQIAIFDKFHSRLHGSLEAYLSLTSSIARTVQGVSKEEQAELEGVRALERLCRIYGSAEYLEKKMLDWSDDVFFLELWEELQERARRNAEGKGLVGPMSIEDVADRTSSAVGSEEESGALFDETAGAYRRLRIRTKSIIQDTLIHSIREALRSYARINPWSSLSESTDPSSLALTAELDVSIQLLNDYIAFLSKALAQAPLRRIIRQLALFVQSFFWENVLMRRSFSSSGVAQLLRDVGTIWEVVDRYLGAGQGELGMRKLREALTLLGLPATPRTGERRGEEEDASLTLWDVERRIFQDNESCREVLDELGIQILSESDARHVMGRRIEVGN